MNLMEVFPSVRVENNFDSFHCLPITVMAAVQTLTGTTLSLAEAERITGFRDGVETWTFKTMAWFANNGFLVKYIDKFDVELFIRDARRFYEVAGESAETIDYILSISNLDHEVDELRACLAMSTFEHLNETPSADAIVAAMGEGWLPMISLNATVLHSSEAEGYDGHIVLATAYDDETLVLQDSGPPARWDWRVPRSALLKALGGPSENSGNVILVKPADPN